MASSQPGTVSSVGGTNGLTAPGASAWVTRPLAVTTIQVTLLGSGQVDATVDVEVSNGPAAGPIALDTPAAVVVLSSAQGQASDGFSISLPWRFVRLNVISISGTGAKVTGLVGA